MKKFLKKNFLSAKIKKKRKLPADTFFYLGRSDLQVVCWLLVLADLSQNRRFHSHNRNDFFFFDHPGLRQKKRKCVFSVEKWAKTGPISDRIGVVGPFFDFLGHFLQKWHKKSKRTKKFKKFFLKMIKRKSLFNCENETAIWIAFETK